jgi:hypothetical protein
MTRPSYSFLDILSLCSSELKSPNAQSVTLNVVL